MAQILIIEDDDRIRGLLLNSLRDMGHATASASTGMAGLSLAVDTGFDLVILDLGLPDVDGTQVLSMLRGVSAVPVIVASARDDDLSLVDALNTGADDYVVKPYTTHSSRPGSGPCCGAPRPAGRRPSRWWSATSASTSTVAGSPSKDGPSS